MAQLRARPSHTGNCKDAQQSIGPPLTNTDRVPTRLFWHCHNWFLELSHPPTQLVSCLPSALDVLVQVFLRLHGQIGEKTGMGEGGEKAGFIGSLDPFASLVHCMTKQLHRHYWGCPRVAVSSLSGGKRWNGDYLRQHFRGTKPLWDHRLGKTRTSQKQQCNVWLLVGVHPPVPLLPKAPNCPSLPPTPASSKSTACPLPTAPAMARLHRELQHVAYRTAEQPFLEQLRLCLQLLPA